MLRIARAHRRPAVAALGALVLAGSLVYVARAVDPAALGRTWAALAGEPALAGAVLLCYLGAFVLRAALWARLLPGLSLGQALAGLHLALGANHVLPLRLGEPLRVTSVVSRARQPLARATASTVMLRGADLVCVAALALGGLGGAWAWWALGPALMLWLAGSYWLRRLWRRDGHRPGLGAATVLTGAALAWLLEAPVTWAAARWAGIELSAAEAVLVGAVTIAAQVAALAPAGLGTYEAAATAALTSLGAAPGPALAAALTAHALKTAYALAAGTLALFVPQPGALGRFRLPRHRSCRPPAPAPPGPVVLFMPAHNEREAIGPLLARVPHSVHGRPVEVLVIDDGSSDGTAAQARAAGAEVICKERNAGLGAAVRTGLEVALARGAAAIAFCDADGEYAPEELPDLVAPILTGRADYVVGSRFAGRIERMFLHRRVGNHTLTLLLRFIARAPISDGQSGYRALSRRAAQEAEIIHDFNYAQVLTLDLIDKGFVYAEVPITYGYRTTGRSFVKLGRYLRRVIPAIYRELNAA